MSSSKINEFCDQIGNFLKKDIGNGDVFRDTAIRYCGYANEVGESFRPIIPKGAVHFSYAIAIAYVLADCVDKTVKQFKKPAEFDGKQIAPAAKVAGDVFLWQMLASVIIPGVVINRITWSAGKLCNLAKIKGLPRKWAPTCIGLAAIPIIIRPIDYGVDHVMDETYRKILN